MKTFALALLFTTVAVAAPNSAQRILPVTKEHEAMKKEKLARDQAAKEKLSKLDKKEEDCDDKAKKPVEITPQSISLSGTAGCTLDEAH
jgi:hypothetical protein